MKLTETAVRRGVTSVMIYLIAIGFGLFSLARLRLDLYPKLEFPIMAVISQYTGVGPYDIETVVTRPIEEVIASVENVEKVTSTSQQGLSLVMLEFDWGTDMDQAEIDVRNNLEFIRDYLPEDMSDPMIFKFDPSSQPILYMSVRSDIHGLAELRYISEHDIEPRMERINGVASAFTSGGMEREIRVLVDNNRLRAHHLSIPQISNALMQNNIQMPAGWIENENQEFTIQTAGEYTSVDQIANTAIATINGSVIRIKDVAEVVDGFKEQRQRIWTNGAGAVMLMVQKQSDANTVTVCRNVISQFDEIEAELPKGVSLEIFWDQSDFINRSMSNLGSTAIQAIFLAFLILLLFLRNFRSSTIVALSIPISMVVTFAVMDQSGLTLNIISMAGLALAVGLLVDNSIVVLESIFRYRELGENAKDAANKGASEVAMAITASTLTTLSVFVPVLFVPGIAGEMFREMVITICFSLAVSLIIALTLIPLLSSRLLTLADQNIVKKGFWRRLGDRIGNRIDRVRDEYVRILKWSLHHRWKVLIFVGVLFGLSVGLLTQLGGEFIPDNDDGFVAITIDRSAGTSLEQMETTMQKINDIIQESVPEAEMIYANFGQGEGIMAMFSSRSSAEGDATIRLSKLTQRKRSKFEIQDELREKFKNIPDATIAFEDRGAAALFGGGGDIVVRVVGHDLEVAEALANEIKEKVKKVKGVVHTETSMRELRPELLINLDRQRIADLGLSTAQVGQAVSTGVLGTVVTRYRDGGNEYDVRVQLNKEARTSKEDIENILVTTMTGQQIPLRALSTVEYTKAPQEIVREDQERYVSVNIDISGRDLSSVTSDVREIMRETRVPRDFRLEIGGTAEEQMESFLYLGLAMLVAIVLTYMVMASQFESFIDPFIILFTIPLSIIGVALGLFITGTTINVMALIGIIMLVGIVVNNGIVLVDYINQLRERGKELYEAIAEAGHVRFRPVLMTALTTILAMLPLALGLGESGESWAPMARSVMGGLTVATILTLVVVPVIYAVVEITARRMKARRAARRAKRRQQAQPQTV
ncbi:efflux RND transporter permease subunit [candidate division KSB1 bacterium]|nr:efflux RND transporter permease subunit [candidate division KSB1 bacterium]